MKTLKIIIIVLSMSILIIDYNLYHYGLNKVQYYRLPFGFKTEYYEWPLGFAVTDKFGFILFGKNVGYSGEVKISKANRYTYDDTLLIAEVLDSNNKVYFVKYFASPDPEIEYEMIEAKSIDESNNYKWINLQNKQEQLLYKAIADFSIIIDIILIYIYLRKRKKRSGKVKLD